MLVLYVAGWGRSGSTLLGNLLGEIPGYLSVGEIRYLFHPGITCGCGHLAADCPFWGEVTAEAEWRVGPIDRRAFIEQQEHALPPKRVPLLLWKGLGADAASVLRITQALRTAAAEVSGADVVVDGSKHPGDLVALRSYPGLRAVHLIRDPRATGYSWSRRRRNGQQALTLTSATWRWIEWNLLTELALIQKPALRLQYLDFIQNPLLHVNRIAEFVGTDSRLPDGIIAAGVAKLKTNHAIGGNPSKFQTGEVQLTPDTAWKRDLGRLPTMLVTAMTWPLMLRYGCVPSVGPRSTTW